MEAAGQAGEGGMTMRKKIWMAALCAAMLLTGCGIPDAVADECRRVARSAGFAGSEEDKAAFQRAVRRSEGQWEPAVISADREQKIDSLVEFLEKKAAAGTIRLLESAFSESDISDAWEEDEDDAEGDFSEFRTWKTDIETEKKVFRGEGELLEGSFYVRGDQMPEVLQGLSRIGFGPVELPDADMEYYSQQVLGGVGFTFSYDTDRKEYSVYLELNMDSLVYPERYGELLENQMRDAFMVSRIVCGGELEFIAFQGGDDPAGSSYSKAVELFFKEGRVLQAEIGLRQDSFRKGGLLFNEEERRDLTGLLTWFAGDAGEAERFLKDLEEKNGKEGTIGGSRWYRFREGMEGEERVRIIPE